MSEQTRSFVSWLPKLFPAQGEWSEEDYFNLPDSNMIIELSDGVITMAPTPTPTHQRVVRILGFSLHQYITTKKLGEIFLAPISVRLWEGTIREPDILWLRPEHSDYVNETHIEGAPDWVAEVISPSSKKTDTETKMFEYAHAGIPEYWLLDPKRETIQVYVLAEGAYTLHSTYKRGDVAKAQTIPGFEIAVSEVFDA
jgi:Uma2 family endonuclease